MAENVPFMTFEAWRVELLRKVLHATDQQINDGEFADVTIPDLQDIARARWLEANGMVDLNTDQRLLFDLMSDISEEAYCAGWTSGNEFRLWAMLVEPDDSRSYGRADVQMEQIAEMRRLSDRIGGWIEYVIDESIDRAGWGERFVPIEHWLPRFRAYREEFPGVLS